MATSTFNKEIVIETKADRERLKAIFESPLPKERIRTLPAYSQAEKEKNEKLFFQCLSRLKA